MNKKEYVSVIIYLFFWSSSQEAYLFQIVTKHYFHYLKVYIIITSYINLRIGTHAHQQKADSKYIKAL